MLMNNAAEATATPNAIHTELCPKRTAATAQIMPAKAAEGTKKG